MGEGGVGSEGVVPKLLHCCGTCFVTEGEPFEDVGSVVGLACAKGHGVLHRFKGDWADEHRRDID